MKKLYVVIAVLVIIGLISWGGWHLKRWWNYTWGYESQVTETVCEMVKPEYLKNPSRCD